MFLRYDVNDTTSALSKLQFIVGTGRTPHSTVYRRWLKFPSHHRSCLERSASAHHVGVIAVDILQSSVVLHLKTCLFFAVPAYSDSIAVIYGHFSCCFTLRCVRDARS